MCDRMDNVISSMDSRVTSMDTKVETMNADLNTAVTTQLERQDLEMRSVHFYTSIKDILQ